MTTTINNFESFDEEQSNFMMQTDYIPGPGDENNDDDDKNDDDDTGNAAGDDSPPLDDEVVHSPLTTQPGKPKS